MTAIYRDISLGRSTAIAMKDLYRWMPSLKDTCDGIGVTGRLLYDGKNYVSVLEGSPQRVKRAKRMIDKRLIRGPFRTLMTDTHSTRDYAGWTLAFLCEEHHIEIVNQLARIESSDQLLANEFFSRLQQAPDLRPTNKHQRPLDSHSSLRQDVGSEAEACRRC